MKVIEAFSELDQAIIEEANQAIPSLTSCKPYKMKDFCSERFLEDFDVRLLPTVGRRFATLVSLKHLPLVFVGKDDRNHRIYRKL